MTSARRKESSLLGAMPLPLGKAPSYPYARESDKDSVGRYLGSVQFSILNGRLSCWEATGIARSEFTDKLGVEITQYLDCNSELTESGVHFHISLYMVGKSPLRAKPTVMFVSGDAKVRKDAFKIINQSGILASYPGFALAHISLETEYRDFCQLAGGAQGSYFPNTSGAQQEIQQWTAACQADSGVTSSAPTKIMTTRGGNNNGRRLYFDNPSSGVPGQRSIGTAGGIVSFHDRYFFLTIFHAASYEPTRITTEAALSILNQGVDDEKNSSEECEIIGFDDLDLESDNSAADFAEETSRGSATPESPNSSRDDTGSAPSVAEATTLDEPESAIQKGSAKIAELRTSQADTATILAGEAILSSSEFDCLLVELDPWLFSDVKDKSYESSIPLEDYSAHVEMDARDATVVSNTPGGRIHGSLSGTPSFGRLPFSRRFHLLYTARFSPPLVAGDCGSWVRDAVTGKLFGHVIAGSPTTGLVSIVPAHQTFPYLLSELKETAAKKPAQTSKGPSSLHSTHSLKPQTGEVSGFKYIPPTSGIERVECEDGGPSSTDIPPFYAPSVSPGSFSGGGIGALSPSLTYSSPGASCSEGRGSMPPIGANLAPIPEWATAPGSPWEFLDIGGIVGTPSDYYPVSPFNFLPSSIGAFKSPVFVGESP